MWRWTRPYGRPRMGSAICSRRLPGIIACSTLRRWWRCGLAMRLRGRWGNYFNGEAHGGPTSLPWAILVDGQLVHPTFLYESLWCLALFFFLSWFDKKKRTAMGQTFSLYLILYSLERFFVEALRTDSLMIGPFKQAQVISVCAIIAGVILYRWSSKRFPLDHQKRQ